MLKKYLVFIVLLISGCSEVPDGVRVVDGFRLDRFLGTWHEIARSDNSFEKNLDRVSAVYSIDDSGRISIMNKGYDVELERWRFRQGKAHISSDKSKGALKVSFFGSFYSEYNIIALDKEHYSWAIACGRDRSMFWILSREPVIDKALMKRLAAKVDSLGFDTTKLRYAGYSGKPKDGGN
ncbi:lipocalin family protein [Chlorobium limicola]